MTSRLNHLTQRSTEQNRAVALNPKLVDLFADVFGADFIRNYDASFLKGFWVEYKLGNDIHGVPDPRYLHPDDRKRIRSAFLLYAERKSNSSSPRREPPRPLPTEKTPLMTREAEARPASRSVDSNKTGGRSDAKGPADKERKENDIGTRKGKIIIHKPVSPRIETGLTPSIAAPTTWEGRCERRHAQKYLGMLADAWLTGRAVYIGSSRQETLVDSKIFYPALEAAGAFDQAAMAARRNQARRIETERLEAASDPLEVSTPQAELALLVARIQDLRLEDKSHQTVRQLKAFLDRNRDFATMVEGLEMMLSYFGKPVKHLDEFLLAHADKIIASKLSDVKKMMAEKDLENVAAGIAELAGAAKRLRALSRSRASLKNQLQIRDKYKNLSAKLRKIANKDFISGLSLKQAAAICARSADGKLIKRICRSIQDKYLVEMGILRDKSDLTLDEIRDYEDLISKLDVHFHGAIRGEQPERVLIGFATRVRIQASRNKFAAHRAMSNGIAEFFRLIDGFEGYDAITFSTGEWVPPVLGRDMLKECAELLDMSKARIDVIRARVGNRWALRLGDAIVFHVANQFTRSLPPSSQELQDLVRTLGVIAEWLEVPACVDELRRLWSAPKALISRQALIADAPDLANLLSRLDEKYPPKPGSGGQAV